MKKLSNILCEYHKCFMYKIQDDDNLLDHVNKVKVLAYQLTYLEVLMWEKNIVITLFESLPTSYEYLIIALETMPMKQLMME